MALALIVLAIGSVLAGYVGVPAALGGHNEIEHYLAPSFAAHGSAARAAARGGRAGPNFVRPKGPSGASGPSEASASARRAKAEE